MRYINKTYPVLSLVANVAAQVFPDTSHIEQGGSFLFQADYTNMGFVYYGDSTVTTLTGIQLPPGGTAHFSVDVIKGINDRGLHLAELWFITTTTGNKIRTSGLQVE